jgi:hypothetical protein
MEWRSAVSTFKTRMTAMLLSLKAGIKMTQLLRALDRHVFSTEFHKNIK